MRDILNVEEYACRLDKFAMAYIVCKHGGINMKNTYIILALYHQLDIRSCTYESMFVCSKVRRNYIVPYSGHYYETP